MGQQNDAAKTNKHGAVPVSPSLAATPIGNRMVPSMPTVQFGNAVNVANDVHINGLPSFLNVSVAPDKDKVFIPSEGVPRNPTSVALQTANGTMGVIVSPKSVVPAAVTTNTNPSKVEDCYTRLKAAIERAAEQAKTFAKEHPAKAAGEFSIGIPIGAWDSLKDMAGGIYDLAKMGAKAAWNDPLGTLYRMTPMGQAEGLMKDAQAIKDTLKKAEEMDINVGELTEAALEEAKKLAGALLCGMATGLEKAGNDPAAATRELGKVTGSVLLNVGIGAATGGAGEAAAAAGTGAKVAGKVGEAAGALEKIPSLGEKLQDLLKAAKLKKEAKAAEEAKKVQQAAKAEQEAAKAAKAKQDAAKLKREHPDNSVKKNPPEETPHCPLCPAGGPKPSPVNPLLGVKFLSGDTELDFNLPATIPFAWQRIYVSSDARVGLLGQGWSLPSTLQLKPFDDRTVFIDGTAREILFPALPPGGKHRSQQEQILLMRYGSLDDEATLSHSQLALVDRVNPILANQLRERQEAAAQGGSATQAAQRIKEASAACLAKYGFPLDENTWVLETDEGMSYVFRPPKGKAHAWRKAPWPLVAMIDANGQAMHFLIDEDDGVLHAVVDSAGRVYRMSFEATAPINDADQGVRLSGIWLDDTVSIRTGADLQSLRELGHQPSPAVPPLGTRPFDLKNSPWLVRYLFDANGDLQAVVNQMGQITRRFAWRNHILISHKEADSLLCRYEYDLYAAEGRVVRHTTSDGTVDTYEYHANHTAVTDTLGRKTLYHFSGNPRQPGQLWTGITYPNGQRETYEYDGWGQRIATVNSRGQRLDYTLDGKGYPIAIRDARGQSLTLQRNEKGLVTSIRNALGHEWRKIYDAQGRLLAESDPLNQVTTYAYQHADQPGRPSEIRDSKGGVKRLSWTHDGQLASYTDCSGNTTHYGYGKLGRLIRITNAEGKSSEFDYDRQGRMIWTREADGKDEHFSYDSLGRLLAYSDGLGQQTRYVLDQRGMPLSRIDALGNKLTYQYDVVGRLIALTNENGAQWTFTWNIADQLTEEIGFDGRRTAYRYNDSGDLIEKLEYGIPAGQTVRSASSQDPNALLTDPKAWAEHVRANLADPNFNPLGRSLAPSMSDAADAPLIRTIYERDPRGQLQRVITPDSITHYHYDELDRLIQARNAHSRTSFVHDALGQLLEETTVVDGQSFTTRHRYDSLGNRMATVLPDGRTINYLIYGSGHVHQINLDGKVIADMEHNRVYQETRRSQGPLASHFGYDAVGRLQLQRVYSAGVESPPAIWEALGGPRGQNNIAGNPTGFESPAGRLNIPGASPLIQRQYQYDRAGQLISLIDQRKGTTRYRYDGIGQLLSAQTPDELERFAFDPAHNRVPPAGPGTSAPAPNTAATLRLVNNWLNEWEGSQYQHDAHGNRIEQRRPDGSVQRLTWDKQDQLIQVIEERKNKVVLEANYSYDALGRRIRKIVTRYDASASAMSEVTYFMWDGNRLQLEQTINSQSLYLYEIDSFVPLARIDSELLLTASGEHFKDKQLAADDDSPKDAENIDPRAYKAILNRRPESILKALQALPAAKLQLNPLDYMTPSSVPSTTELAQEKPTLSASKTYWYHCDHLGTPQELTDEQGNLVWAARYAAWGRIKKIQRLATHQVGNTLQQVLVEEAPVRQNLRFQGQYEDIESGLHYNRFRYYDPQTGCYLNQDPIGLAGGLNLYKYSTNPINIIDPLGLSSAALDKAIGGRKGDCFQAHHLIPEEIMKDKQFKSMFDKLKSMGFEPDGAGNGIHLPGNQDLAQKTGLPGHWSSHEEYSQGIKNEVGKLYDDWKKGKVSDTQLALGVKDIQNRAKQNIETGRVKISPKCRLL